MEFDLRQKAEGWAVRVCVFFGVFDLKCEIEVYFLNVFSITSVRIAHSSYPMVFKIVIVTSWI